MKNSEADMPNPPPLPDPTAHLRRAHTTGGGRAPGVGATFLQSCLVAGCVTVLVPVLMIGGFFLVTYFLISSTIDQESSSLDALVSGAPNSSFREKLIRAGDKDAGTIVVVAVTGGIDGSGSPIEGDGMLASVSEQLRLAGEDDKVKAVILQVDSPGGGLSASDQLYNEVLKLKKKDRIVLAWAGGMMASGGYYIAAGADGIMASPTSTVGSIGVIMRHFQVSELLKKIGVATDPIVSGERKDLGSPFREMTDDERELLQDYIDAAHRRFVDVVATGRGMDAAEVSRLADGRIFTADAAKTNGLVDRIGYIEDAVKWAEEKAGAKNMRIVVYRRLLSFSDMLREAGRGAAEGAVEAAAGSETHPRAMAVWEGK